MLLLAVHTLWGVEKCLAFALSNGALSWENIPAGDKLGVAALLAASALYGRLRTKAG